MSRQKEYYVFTRPGQMKGHKFTDDVAVCKAISKSQAIAQFSRYYADVQDSEVSRLQPRKYSSGCRMIDYDTVTILTDY
jgi:hypothetical protein